MYDFVHLRLHTEYSVTDSILRIKDAVNLAVANTMPALAITDSHNMFGLVKFYKSARISGIKPIIGCEVNVESTVFNYKIILLAKNMAGYRQICEWLTRSYVENKITDIPYIREEWLFTTSAGADVIVLSGAKEGDVGKFILCNDLATAKARAHKWQQYYADNYFLEIQRTYHPDTDAVVENSVAISRDLKIPVVATHPIEFSHAGDYLAHEVRVCIADGEMLDDGKRVVKYSEDQYFKTASDMKELFVDLPEALTNSMVIAKKCNLEITLEQYFLPQFVPPESKPLDEYLAKLSHEGLLKRLTELFPDKQLRAQQEANYHARLEIEIKTIMEMGFAGYFLIVADFINWAKHNGVPVGPGRGSGAGSLVAFCLGITDLDPLHYNLLFERFLNPDRVSLPDFDIDFCQDKREQVINYVEEKYGAVAVAQIATFGTMSSKAVIKDVGRVLGLPYGLCDSISKLILNTPAKSWSLQEAYQEFSELKSRIDNADDELRRLWDMSLQLEDITRNVGKHAAGVLIAPRKLTDFCPLYVADGMQTSQFDKDDVESIGLVKFDFLGLRNLTIIQEAINNIKQLHGNELTLSNTEFNDKKVYQLLQAGNTTAVFQLESPGMKRLLQKLEPNRFEDIIAVLALYRPGPLGSGMVDDFVKRKKGIAAIDYFHPDLQGCLEPTYGIIVYQEQVMQISQIIGGYTLGGADLLRRAMGKKKPEEMVNHRATFTAGAVAKGYSRDLAGKLFDLMAMFAEYGFNKSHSAAYAVISYHTAYLKAYYPACFMAATMSSEQDKTDKLYEFYQDCKANNLTLLPPDINKSVFCFTPVAENIICYALGAVKGIGKQVADSIVAERQANGSFTGLVDFCQRVDKKVINKRTLENLIKAGCFDSLEDNRSKLFNNLHKLMEFIEQQRLNENQGSLFDVFAGDEAKLYTVIEFDDYPRFILKEQLLLEKQALGYYLTGSLFDEFKDISRQLNIYPLVKFNADDEDIQQLINDRYAKPKPKVLIGGVINYIGYRATRKGGKITFVRIEDDSGEIEVVVFNAEYEQYKALLKIDELVYIEGEVMYDSFRNEVKVTANNIFNLDKLLHSKVGFLEIELHHSDDWQQIKHLLDIDPMATCALKLSYKNAHARCLIDLGTSVKFVPTYAKLGSLSKLLVDNVGKTRWKLGINGV